MEELFTQEQVDRFIVTSCRELKKENRRLKATIDKTEVPITPKAELQQTLPVGIEPFQSNVVRPLGTLLSYQNTIYRIVRHIIANKIVREVIDPVGKLVDGRVERFLIEE